MAAQAVVDDFCREGGDGEALQAMLEEKAANERNWMEEWWEQLAYLRTRTTMAIHINWFGVMPDFGVPVSNVQARGTAVARATVGCAPARASRLAGDRHPALRSGPRVWQAAAMLLDGILKVKAVIEAGKFPVEKLRGARPPQRPHRTPQRPHRAPQRPHRTR